MIGLTSTTITSTPSWNLLGEKSLSPCAKLRRDVAPDVKAHAIRRPRDVRHPSAQAMVLGLLMRGRSRCWPRSTPSGSRPARRSTCAARSPWRSRPRSAAAATLGRASRRLHAGRPFIADAASSWWLLVAVVAQMQWRQAAQLLLVAARAVDGPRRPPRRCSTAPRPSARRRAPGRRGPVCVRTAESAAWLAALHDERATRCTRRGAGGRRRRLRPRAAHAAAHAAPIPARAAEHLKALGTLRYRAKKTRPTSMLATNTTLCSGVRV